MGRKERRHKIEKKGSKKDDDSPTSVPDEKNYFEELLSSREGCIALDICNELALVASTWYCLVGVFSKDYKVLALAAPHQ